MHYEAVQQMAKMLENLSRILAKAAAYAEGRKFDPGNFLQLRLAPDMFPFVRQVQIAADNAKFAGARLTGQEAPRYEDSEASLGELEARIRKTLEFLRSLEPAQFAGAGGRQVRLPFAPDRHLTGDEYLAQMALPNFYFHLTTAYNILRAAGVDLGKGDFIGALPLKGE